MTGIRALFVTNNGLSDHIGTAQVLPYLEGLSARGHEIVCISVERPDKNEVYFQDVVPRLVRAGIKHSPILRYDEAVANRVERYAMPRLLSTRVQRVVDDFSPDLLHCRSYMPLAATLRANSNQQVPFIFDMRGFWVDERRESGVWRGPAGMAYAHYFRKLEAKAFQSASGIVTLTRAARIAVRAHPGFTGATTEVIPCSVDQTVFKPDLHVRNEARESLGFSANELVLVHLGSTGPLYRMDATFRLMSRLEAHGQPVRLLVLGPHSVSDIVSLAARARIKLRPEQVTCLLRPHHEVPACLNAADVGLSFRLQSRSSLGVSATKLAEYLSCGLPVISNDGVGDIHQILPDDTIGLVLDDLSDSSIEAAAKQIMLAPFAARETIHAHAMRFFAIEDAIDKYDALYQRASRKSSAA